MKLSRARHPLPTIEDILTTVGSGKWFSKLDLKWGFHQIMIGEESRQITTFVTHMGLFRFKRLMFGINSTPEMYQHLTSQIIADINGVVELSLERAQVLILVKVIGGRQEGHPVQKCSLLQKSPN